MNGRFNTVHHKSLLSSSSVKIQRLLALLTRMMQCEKSGENCHTLSKSLPEAYQECWHRLLPFGAIYVINFLTGRRALEGLQFMTKDTFQKKYDVESKTYAYEMVIGGLTKNNRVSDQNLEMGGIVPDKIFKSGENFGLFKNLLSHWKQLTMP